MGFVNSRQCVRRSLWKRAGGYRSGEWCMPGLIAVRALHCFWNGRTIRIGTGVHRYEIALIAKRAGQIDQNVERLGFIIRRARGQSGFFARSLSCVQRLICFIEEFVGAVSHLVLPPSCRERDGYLLTLPV